MQNQKSLQLIIDSCWAALMQGGLSSSGAEKIRNQMVEAIKQLESTKVGA